MMTPTFVVAVVTLVSVGRRAANRKCRLEMRLCSGRMTELELRHLRVLVAVAEERSFTQAAARLRLTQPAVSRTVVALERAVGVSLLWRSTHDCALTPAGEVLLAEARTVLESADRAARLARRAGQPARQLIVAAKPDSDAGLLPAMLERYHGGGAAGPARPPAVLLFQETHELAAAVRSGRADVALIVGPADAEGLETDELWQEPRVVVLPAGHALAGRGTIAMADLRDEPAVRWPGVPGPLDRYYRGLDEGQAGAGAGAAGPDAASLLDALRLAELGHGVTFLPQSVAARFPRPGLVARLVDGLSGSTAVATWRAGSRDPAVAAFVQAAVEVAGNEMRRSVVPD